MMARLAFLFPGQGAQDVGMGRELFGRDPFTDALLARASDGAGEDLGRLCRRGPPKRLARTELLQPALTVVCLGLWNRLRQALDLDPVAVAGHSVGELPALAASGAVSAEQAVDLAVLRGSLMAREAGRHAGTMLAVTGAGRDEMERRLAPWRRRGVVGVAAVNAPTQVSVSGDVALLEEVAAKLRGDPSLKVTALRVSGAWHSAHMSGAVAELRDGLDRVSLDAQIAPVVFNRDGGETDDPARVRRNLAEQITRPVRWDRVMARLLDHGVTDIVEIGPGRVLRGLARLNTGKPPLRVHNISDLRSLARLGDFGETATSGMGAREL